MKKLIIKEQRWDGEFIGSMDDYDLFEMLDRVEMKELSGPTDEELREIEKENANLEKELSSAFSLRDLSGMVNSKQEGWNAPKRDCLVDDLKNDIIEIRENRIIYMYGEDVGEDDYNNNIEKIIEQERMNDIIEDKIELKELNKKISHLYDVKSAYYDRVPYEIRKSFNPIKRKMRELDNKISALKSVKRFIEKNLAE